jgi:hypothetical protein
VDSAIVKLENENTQWDQNQKQTRADATEMEFLREELRYVTDRLNTARKEYSKELNGLRDHVAILSGESMYRRSNYKFIDVKYFDEIEYEDPVVRNILNQRVQMIKDRYEQSLE